MLLEDILFLDAAFEAITAVSELLDTLEGVGLFHSVNGTHWHGMTEREARMHYGSKCLVEFLEMSNHLVFNATLGLLRCTVLFRVCDGHCRHLQLQS